MTFLPNRLDRFRTRPRGKTAERLTALRLACGVGALVLALSSCTPQGAESPGIELGAPGTTWASKNTEQRFGFMAAKVHPVMKQLFQEYDPELSDFQCSNCHGTNAEQIDYKMPNTGLYSLPGTRPYDDAIDYNPQMAVFMMTKITPSLQQLLNEGAGEPTKASCFSCHPRSD